MSDARELLAIREIAHAFLLAEHPGDVQQFALDRITPLLGASFSLVMQLGADGALLRPVAQHEWPAPYRPWIGALRVRVGDGPSGVAVAERRLVEVVDLFEEPSLVGWHEVARELGFRSIMAAPLETADGPIGALAFYFADATTVTDEQRALVRLVADQLAAATDKSRRTEALRRANAALAEANAELEQQAQSWAAAQRARDASETLAVDALLALTDAADERNAEQRLHAVHAVAIAAREYVAATQPAFLLEPTDVDPRDVLQEAVSQWRGRAPMVPVQVDEPTVLLPTMRADPRWLRRTVELVLGLAVAGAATEGGGYMPASALGVAFWPCRWIGRGGRSSANSRAIRRVYFGYAATRSAGRHTTRLPRLDRR
ncbi:GAF domain-containing protein [Gemmatimonas sp.]|uniref:GAF domain-containing protein n=1 Tax=Gemmatimonas sp. TaxID=1962908 RepID=UPI003DA6206F